MDRVFIIILDSFGCGELPDADLYGDQGSNTLRSVASSKYFKADNLINLGLFNIYNNGEIGQAVNFPLASYGRAAQASVGKDTTIGHWEICGIISSHSLPLYPDGFPEEVLAEIERLTGIGYLCNKPYSGTEIIKDYGLDHINTKKVIVYTSADSVFQVAAHENYFGLENLYDYCKTARSVLTGKNGVGRVIARPFAGESPENFTRTANRHDYSIGPPDETLFDIISQAGLDTISVGKIFDIFAGRAINKSFPTKSNAEGMKITSELALDLSWRGLCMTNLVDFDMLWGHRNDIDGYAKGIAEFDIWLGDFIKLLGENDALIITADHGCDPGTLSTDHSREYVPVLLYNKKLTAKNLGTFDNFTYIGKLAKDLLNL